MSRFHAFPAPPFSELYSVQGRCCQDDLGPGHVVDGVVLIWDGAWISTWHYIMKLTWNIATTTTTEKTAHLKTLVVNLHINFQKNVSSVQNVVTIFAHSNIKREVPSVCRSDGHLTGCTSVSTLGIVNPQCLSPYLRIVLYYPCVWRVFYIIIIIVTKVAHRGHITQLGHLLVVVGGGHMNGTSQGMAGKFYPLVIGVITRVCKKYL